MNLLIVLLVLAGPSSKKVVQPSVVLGLYKSAPWQALLNAEEMGLVDGRWDEGGTLEKEYGVDLRVIYMYPYDELVNGYRNGDYDAVGVSSLDAISVATVQDSVAVAVVSSASFKAEIDEGKFPREIYNVILFRKDYLGEPLGKWGAALIIDAYFKAYREKGMGKHGNHEYLLESEKVRAHIERKDRAEFYPEFTSHPESVENVLWKFKGSSLRKGITENAAFAHQIGMTPFELQSISFGSGDGPAALRFDPTYLEMVVSRYRSEISEEEGKRGSDTLRTVVIIECYLIAAVIVGLAIWRLGRRSTGL